jgi:hypothetical protein
MMGKEAVMASYTVLNISELGKSTRNLSEDFLEYEALVVPSKL